MVIQGKIFVAPGFLILEYQLVVIDIHLVVKIDILNLNTILLSDS